MSCNLIQILNGEKMARPVKTREEYIRLRNNSINLELLKGARDTTKTAKERNGMKAKLVQFNYSGYYPTGRVKGNQLPAKAYMFDIDDKETFERVAAVMLERPEDYGLLMLERSVNGGGHAVLKRSQGHTILENQVSLSLRLKCEMDNNAHDINRVVFTTSANPEDLLYLNDDLFGDEYDEKAAKAEAKALKERESGGEEDVPQSAHKANKHYRPWEDGGAPAASSPMAGEAEDGKEPEAYPTEYNGIPYQKIIDTYWHIHNDGKTPEKGNRNTCVYELAYDLRHICGFNPYWLNAVIPDYNEDGDFGAEEKMNCITNAVNCKKTQMTKKLKEVLHHLKEEYHFSPQIIAALDCADEMDSAFFAKQLPQLPLGLNETVLAVGDQLTMAALFAVFPAIGALATRVKINVHGQYNNINLITYVAGDFASGKGSIDPLIAQWMEEVKDQDKQFLHAEREWRKRSRMNRNAKTQEQEPNDPIRYITLNNTVANLADRLAKCDGLHAFSFTPEADTLASKWKSGVTDFSIMLRQAYDGSPFDREAKSVDAVNVHIERLLWNVVMCGTPDALFRVVSNYTDGFLSRIAIARTPDNTFSPLPKHPSTLTDELKQKIRIVAHILPMLSGQLQLHELEEVGADWLDKVRLEALKNNDAVTARARIRSCVTAQRMVACVILCATIEQMLKKKSVPEVEAMLTEDKTQWIEVAEKVGKDEKILSCFAVFADYMMENSMTFFHDKIEDAMSSKEYTGSSRKRSSDNKSAFEALPERFTPEEAYSVLCRFKRKEVTEANLRRILRSWCEQKLAVPGQGGYIKVSTMSK